MAQWLPKLVMHVSAQERSQMTKAVCVSTSVWLSLWIVDSAITACAKSTFDYSGVGSASRESLTVHMHWLRDVTNGIIIVQHGENSQAKSD